MKSNSKTLDTLEYIKNSADLNNTMSYLLEEQYIILDICQRKLESVPLNSHVNDQVATYVANTCLAMWIYRNTLHSYISL